MASGQKCSSQVKRRMKPFLVPRCFGLKPVFCEGSVKHTHTHAHTRARAHTHAVYFKPIIRVVEDCILFNTACLVNLLCIMVSRALCARAQSATILFQPFQRCGVGSTHRQGFDYFGTTLSFLLPFDFDTSVHSPSPNPPLFPTLFPLPVFPSKTTAV